MGIAGPACHIIGRGHVGQGGVYGGAALPQPPVEGVFIGVPQQGVLAEVVRPGRTLAFGVVNWTLAKIVLTTQKLVVC